MRGVDISIVVCGVAIFWCLYFLKSCLLFFMKREDEKKTKVTEL